MKIATVKLVDFQSHEETVVDFSEGFNVIVGKTNHGKSAIFRALRHAFFDSWNKRYVRTGKKNYQIEILFDTGEKLIRLRGEKNEVRFISQKGEETKFESFGDSLPQIAKDLLHIPDFKIDTDKEINVNVASQQDPLFLISPQAYSAPLVSKFFSRLSGIHILDAANRNVDKDKKNNMEKVKFVDETISKNTVIVKDLERVLEWKKVIDQKVKEVQTIEQKEILLKQLSDLLIRIKLYNEKRKKLDLISTQIDKVNLTEIDSFIAKSETLISHYELLDKILKIKTQLSSVNSKMTEYSDQLLVVENEKAEFLTTLKLCPFCGNEINSETLSCRDHI